MAVPRGASRIVERGFCLYTGVSGPWAAVERLRLAPDEVEGALARVRTHMRAYGKTIGSWWLTDLSQPPDLHERLLALGLVIVEDDYAGAGLALEREPPPAPADVEVVRADTLDLFVEAEEVAWEGFGTPEEQRAARRPHLPAAFAAEQETRAFSLYLARVDGRAAASGRALFAARGALLSGGATAPWARGRGAYRALVRARWDEAVARGTPTLVVGAGRMSEPILRRLGFRELLRFRRLEDRVPSDELPTLGP